MAGNATLLVVASAGHSGSTLLDLLLGNHSEVCSAGEMNRLTLHAADRVCACGATVTQCPHWNGVRAEITKQWNRQSLIRWDECHTDIPPQEPLLRVPGAALDGFADGAPLPPSLRLKMADAGLAISERATLSRKGVRDFKWRLSNHAPSGGYVLRTGEGCLEVYSADVKWKNPIRIVPDPIEVALALGVRFGLDLVRACSNRAARFVRVGKNSWSVVNAMSKVTGAKYVVDSSKSPVRVKLLYMLQPDKVRFVHLVRDGRAVAASAIRRRELSPSMAARIWRRDNQNLSAMLRTVPENQKLDVRYEALCADPEHELRRICDFLALRFEKGMLTLWEREVHNIPGNPMLFDRKTRTIRQDERWRRDLSDRDIRAFDRTAGRLNRALGYV